MESNPTQTPRKVTMDAELVLRFKSFPQSSKKSITKALHYQNRKDGEGYKEAIDKLPREELDWLIDYQTNLLKSTTDEKE